MAASGRYPCKPARRGSLYRLLPWFEIATNDLEGRSLPVTMKAGRTPVQAATSGSTPERLVPAWDAMPGHPTSKRRRARSDESLLSPRQLTHCARNPIPNS